MTIKQVIVGGLLGAAAIATMVHRLPRSTNPTTTAKLPERHVTHSRRSKSETRVSQGYGDNTAPSEARLSSSKLYN